MSFIHFFRFLRRTPKKSRQPYFGSQIKRLNGFRPHLENLEDRTLLSTNATTHLMIEMPFAAEAGYPALVRVIPLDSSNHIVTNYTGTIHFTSSDAGATLPADYTFTIKDDGAHNFKVFFATAGSETVTATDTVTASITGSGVTTVLGAACRRHPAGASTAQRHCRRGDFRGSHGPGFFWQRRAKLHRHGPLYQQ